MSRTISQLDLGTSVYLEENGVATEYILVSKDSAGCILLRALAFIQKRMNPTNTAQYEGCEADVYLNDETDGFMSIFDTPTKNAIVARSRPTYNYGDTDYHNISRRAFLLTYGEVFGSTNTALEPLNSVAPALVKWSNKLDWNQSRIAYNVSAQAVYWWIASPYSATAFSRVLTTGSADSGSASNANTWLRPALNVASGTIVSDEGQSTIYLLPDLYKTYREISFSAEAATSNLRPSKVNIKYDATNLYDISCQVCNNFGDAIPVWVNCTSGQTVELTNTTKETANWKIGMKFYGKSQGLGWVEEPIIKWLEVA